MNGRRGGDSDQWVTCRQGGIDRNEPVMEGEWWVSFWIWKRLKQQTIAELNARTCTICNLDRTAEHNLSNVCVCVRACVCECLFVCARTQVCACVCVCERACVWACMCEQPCVYARSRECVCEQACCGVRVSVCVCACVRECEASMCVQVCVCARVCVRMCLCLTMHSRGDDPKGTTRSQQKQTVLRPIVMQDAWKL